MPLSLTVFVSEKPGSVRPSQPRPLPVTCTPTVPTEEKRSLTSSASVPRRRNASKWLTCVTTTSFLSKASATLTFLPAVRGTRGSAVLPKEIHFPRAGS